MNNISWFLYAVDVIGNLDEMFAVVGGISIIVMVLLSVALGVVLADNHKTSGEENFVVAGKLWLKRLIITTIICFVVSGIIPSPRTMYLIMGSEVGEEVVKSETGKRVQDAINKKLDEYLGEDE